MTGIPTPPAAPGPAAAAGPAAPGPAAASGPAAAPGPAAPASRTRPRIDLYGHSECCLCRTAMDVLERLRGEFGFTLVEHDIASDAVLHRAYFERVPVICLNGEELSDYRVEEAPLRARLDDLESRR